MGAINKPARPGREFSGGAWEKVASEPAKPAPAAPPYLARQQLPIATAFGGRSFEALRFRPCEVCVAAPPVLGLWVVSSQPTIARRRHACNPSTGHHFPEEWGIDDPRGVVVGKGGGRPCVELRQA